MHLPEWASGLGDGLRHDGEDWIIAAPEGEARVRFTPRNDFGVLDHWVTLPSEQTVYIPLRVIANGNGAEVTLTLIRQPQMSDADFARDADWVLRDLNGPVVLRDVMAWLEDWEAPLPSGSEAPDGWPDSLCGAQRSAAPAS